MAMCGGARFAAQVFRDVDDLQSLDELEALDLLEPSASEPDMERPVWERGWFWGLVAAVGVGAAVGAAAAVVSDRQELICVGSAGVDCSGGL